MAGRGALVSEHPLSLGAVGATGTQRREPARARRRPRDRDRDALERFHDRVEVGVPGSGRPLRQRQRGRVRRRQAQRAAARGRCAGRARAAARRAGGHRVDPDWERRARSEARDWAGRGRAVDLARRRPGGARRHRPQIIGAINDAAGETGVSCARRAPRPATCTSCGVARDPAGKGYHVEYGYSCMGYEIPGGIGVKLAAPEREVYVLVGDGSYLMMPGRARDRGRRAGADRDRAGRQPRLRVDRRAVAVDRLVRVRDALPVLGQRLGAARPGVDSEVLPLDLAANAESLGARVVRASTIAELRDALAGARGADGPVVVHIEADRYHGRARLRELVGRAGRRGLRRGGRARGARGATSARTSSSGTIWRHPDRRRRSSHGCYSNPSARQLRRRRWTRRRTRRASSTSPTPRAGRCSRASRCRAPRTSTRPSRRPATRCPSGARSRRSRVHASCSNCASGSSPGVRIWLVR